MSYPIATVVVKMTETTAGLVATPESGAQSLYLNLSDHLLYRKNASGTSVAIGSGGSGSGVSSVAAGTGMSFSTITTTGSVAIDTAVVPTITGTATLTNKTLSAAVLKGTQTFTNASGTQLLSLAFDTIIPGSAVIQAPNTTYLAFFDTNTDGFKIQGSITYLRCGGADVIQSTSNGIAPATDAVQTLGTSALRFGQAWSKVYASVLGANLSSSGTNVTIAPTSGIHHVIGVGSIQTISLPITGFVGSITLIPDAVFTTATGGNIAIGTTSVVGKALTMTYDGTSWYPSYLT